MAINSDIRDQAYQFFVEEAPELLQAIESELLTLSQSPAQVHILMRSAHSLKGGAASVGLEPIAAIAHRLETIFKALYSDTLTLDRALEDQILQAYDCLRLPLMEQITTGGFDAAQALAAANPVFDRLEERCGDAISQTETYIPSSADMGVDMVASILEVDVAEGLDRLAAVVANPQAYEVAGELRAQVEVFAGFAELLSLPQFGTIAASVQQALDVDPDRALEITRQALTDFSQCRQAMLSGDSARATVPDWSGESLTEAVSQFELTATSAEVAAAFETLEDIPLFEGLEDFQGLEDIFGGADFDEESIAAFDESAVNIEANLEAEEIVSITVHDIDFTAEDDRKDITEIILEPIDVEWVNMPPVKSGNIVPFPLGGAIQLRKPADLPNQSLDVPLKNTSKIVPAIAAELVPQPLRDGAPQPLRDRPAETQTAALTVRVDSARLEKMNNLVGELAINRDAQSLQNDQLQSVVRELLNRFGRFQTLVNELQTFSDRMLVAPERYPVATNGNGASTRLDAPAKVAAPDRFSTDRLSANQSSTDRTTAEFDALELDSYGALHPQLQEILENMVQLEETVDDVALFARQSNQMLDQQRNRLSQLQDEVIWARMLPIGEVLNRFPRILRDLSTTYQKSVQLKLVGTTVLVEKAILEKLYDPLLHLLRNAFDHGIEPAHIRQKQGKPEQGTIEMRAYHKGNQTIIEVRDDGKGLSLERIRSRAFELGWLSLEQLAVTTPAELFEFIFEPGFSTADRVSELSGRGVGLDVVRSQLRSLKGTVSVTSIPEAGTTFTLCLPLTLTITKLIICLINSTAIALPADSVEEILTPQPEHLKLTETQQFLQWREQLIPTYRLSELLTYNCPTPTTPPSRALMTAPVPQDWALPMLILRQEEQLFALEVDRLVTEQELVIKPFGKAITPPRYTYGCTILGDGSLVPVIDSSALLSVPAKSTRGDDLRSIGDHRPSIAAQPVQAPAILVVDDAVTLRRTLALSLERSGFRVLQAKDGRDAIAQLQQNPFVKLVVCDVEMPNMNGFEFLSHRRQDPQLSNIPIVMLTSRSNDKHRWLALQLGATDYFTKPYLEQEFLAAIDRILSEE